MVSLHRPMEDLIVGIQERNGLVVRLTVKQRDKQDINRDKDVITKHSIVLSACRLLRNSRSIRLKLHGILSRTI